MAQSRERRHDRHDRHDALLLSIDFSAQMEKQGANWKKDDSITSQHLASRETRFIQVQTEEQLVHCHSNRPSEVFVQIMSTLLRIYSTSGVPEGRLQHVVTI